MNAAALRPVILTRTHYKDETPARLVGKTRTTGFVLCEVPGLVRCARFSVKQHEIITTRFDRKQA